MIELVIVKLLELISTLVGLSMNLLFSINTFPEFCLMKYCAVILFTLILLRIRLLFTLKEALFMNVALPSDLIVKS